MSKQPITIRVSGTHTSYHDAERAQLRIRVSRTHTDQSECYESVSGVTNDLHRWFKDLSPKDQSGEPAPEAAVTWFSMGMLTTSSWVPYAPLDSKGNPRPPPPREYKVSTNFEVKVKDLGKLSELALVLAKTEHVTLENISWKVTEKTERSLRRSVRQGAMREATEKAQDFAAVYTPEPKLRCVEIGDGSLRNRAGGAGPGSHQPMMMRAAKFGGGDDGGESVSFQPEQVSLTAEVNCVFELEQ